MMGSDSENSGWESAALSAAGPLDGEAGQFEESLISEAFRSISLQKDGQDNRYSSMSNDSLPLERMAPLGASATDTEDFPDCHERFA